VKLQRYDITYNREGDANMYPTESGPYVRFESTELLRADNKALLDALEKIAIVASDELRCLRIKKKNRS
jgi:hypothetical protein